MMVLMAKLPSKLLPVASVYRPTAQVHAANDALMVRGYKHMTGTSRHAHTDALWGHGEHGRQGLARSSHSWQVAVVREWVRQGAWAKEEFRASQAHTLRTHRVLEGGCPAAFTLGQYTHHPRCPHLIHLRDVAVLGVVHLYPGGGGRHCPRTSMGVVPEHRPSIHIAHTHPLQRA